MDVHLTCLFRALALFSFKMSGKDVCHYFSILKYEAPFTCSCANTECTVRYLLVSPSATNRALFTGEGALERRLGGESAPQKGSRGSATGAGTDVGEAVRES